MSMPRIETAGKTVSPDKLQIRNSYKGVKGYVTAAVWVNVVDAHSNDGMQWLLDSKGRVPVFEDDDGWDFINTITPHNGWYPSLRVYNIVDERL